MHQIQMHWILCYNRTNCPQLTVPGLRAFLLIAVMPWQTTSGWTDKISTLLCSIMADSCSSGKTCVLVLWSNRTIRNWNDQWRQGIRRRRLCSRNETLTQCFEWLYEYLIGLWVKSKMHPFVNTSYMYTAYAHRINPLTMICIGSSVRFSKRSLIAR